ncbi:MAG: glycosyltransferase family 2 protein [Candidatus Marinimicrobia bacterium]|nr:glycosyltransferase family 2 protein [Candidatus Neomarinimicrobiota bacterium]
MKSRSPQISIIIVTWNSIKYLPPLFDSLKSQTKNDFEIVVVDNGSSDSSVSWIETNYPSAKILRNKTNLGFAAANNQGIRESAAPYVVLCNTDIVMSSNFLEELHGTINNNPKVGSVGGKLLKTTQDLNNITESDTIDSTGIALYKSRRAVDRGENDKDVGQFDNTEEIFGISAALVMYRKDALDAVSLNGQCFDESFFSYKEDIDLAWRLQLAGYRSIYVSTAKAFHARGAARKTDLSDSGAIINRQKKSPKINYLSYRNHFYLIIKNEKWKNIFFNPFLILYEFKKMIYLLFREPASLKGIFSLYANLPQMLKKRRYIQENKMNKENLSKWFQ